MSIAESEVILVEKVGKLERTCQRLKLLNASLIALTLIGFVTLYFVSFPVANAQTFRTLEAERLLLRDSAGILRAEIGPAGRDGAVTEFRLLAPPNGISPGTSVRFSLIGGAIAAYLHDPIGGNLDLLVGPDGPAVRLSDNKGQMLLAEIKPKGPPRLYIRGAGSASLLSDGPWAELNNTRIAFLPRTR